MLNEVTKYLIQHKLLSLPGIGNFYVETKPAQLDFVNRCITSKENKILFSNNKPEPENRFYSFLSYELNADGTTVKLAFKDYVSQLNNDLNIQKKVYLHGIGTLTKQSANVIEFLPEAMPVFFPELTAEKIIRKNAAHTVRVGEDEKTSEEMHAALHTPKIIRKEKWLIAASILALIGVAAIVLYYTAFN